MPFGRQKNERNVLGTASADEVKEEENEEEEEEERWRGGDCEEVRSCCCWNSWKSRRKVCGKEGLMKKLKKGARVIGPGFFFFFP